VIAINFPNNRQEQKQQARGETRAVAVVVAEGSRRRSGGGAEAEAKSRREEEEVHYSPTPQVELGGMLRCVQVRRTLLLLIFVLLSHAHSTSTLNTHSYLSDGYSWVCRLTEREWSGADAPPPPAAASGCSPTYCRRYCSSSDRTWSGSRWDWMRKM